MRGRHRLRGSLDEENVVNSEPYDDRQEERTMEGRQLIQFRGPERVTGE